MVRRSCPVCDLSIAVRYCKANDKATPQAEAMARALVTAGAKHDRHTWRVILERLDEHVVGAKAAAEIRAQAARETRACKR